MISYFAANPPPKSEDSCSIPSLTATIKDRQGQSDAAHGPKLQGPRSADLNACRPALYKQPNRLAKHTTATSFPSIPLLSRLSSASPRRAAPHLLGSFNPSPKTTEPSRARAQLELANHHSFPGAAAAGPQPAEPEEERNRFQVLILYEAMNTGDVRRAQQLLEPDLEWWFHGPPARQHMMRLLTGAESGATGAFAFSPRSVQAFGSTVIAEGADDARQLYWVHAWTVGADGVITQLREYFNTDLTVTLLSATAKNAIAAASMDAASPSSSSGTKCLWQSRRDDRANKSLPGLVLTI
jgi:ketosteroid isomerase-like protein